MKNLCVFDCLIWTFNLPNFQDRVIQGSGTRGNVGTYKSESLPNITGSIEAGDDANGSALFRNGVGALSLIGRTSKRYASGNAGPAENRWGFIIDASHSSSSYKSNAPVQQNALLIQCCIKY